MRCPKCGYISFDHLEECLKCNKNIKTAVSDLFGSTYNVQAPNFLKLPQEQNEEPSGKLELSEAQSFGAGEEYVDEALEILVEEEDADLHGEIGFVEDEQADFELIEEDEDAGEIEIDLSQFEDADEFKVDLFDEDEVQQEQLEQPSPAMEMPQELSDISDLAPPDIEIKEDEPAAGNSADLDLADLDLDDLNFDLGLDGLDGEQPNRPEVVEEAVLALDDIDFSETLAESSSDTSKKIETMDMDDSLDFDLDLGGLSIHSEA